MVVYYLILVVLLALLMVMWKDYRTKATEVVLIVDGELTDSQADRIATEIAAAVREKQAA